MPLISVIIPTYNRLTMLERAVHSVLAQTHADWELLIADDGSSDGTADFLTQLQRTWSRPQRLHCLKQANHGVSHARNRAAEQARGAWLAFLDSDDEWLPDKLARQVPLCADFCWIHGEEIWMRNGRRVNPLVKHAKSGGLIFSRCVELCCVSPSTALIQTDLFHALKGFREDFPVCEDFELWLRLAATNRAGFVQEALIIRHGGHDDQLSRRFHSMDYFRIKALSPFLHNASLEREERKLVASTIEQKCGYLLKGYRKHGQERNVGEVLAWQAQALNALTQLQMTHSAAESLPRSLASLTL